MAHTTTGTLYGNSNHAYLPSVLQAVLKIDRLKLKLHIFKKSLNAIHPAIFLRRVTGLIVLSQGIVKSAQ
jgi:hypothetical protein